MKVIITKKVCDICNDRGEETLADHGDVPVALGERTVLLDLCAADIKVLAEVLANALALGRRPEGAPQRRSRAEMARLRAAGVEPIRPSTNSHKPKITAAIAPPIAPTTGKPMVACDAHESDSTIECDRMFDTVQGRNMHKIRAHRILKTVEAEAV